MRCYNQSVTDSTRRLDSKATGQLIKINFKDRLVNLADELAHGVYPLTYKFPQEERYALADQLRRSIISVPANLIEGIARGGEKEKRQFANIAYGSLKEAKYLVYFSYKQGIISQTDYEAIAPKFEEMSRLLFSFLKILKK